MKLTLSKVITPCASPSGMGVTCCMKPGYHENRVGKQNATDKSSRQVLTSKKGKTKINYFIYTKYPKHHILHTLLHHGFHLFRP